MASGSSIGSRTDRGMTPTSQHSLVTRASLSILAVATLVGLLYLWLGHALTMEREANRAKMHLQGLLDTVDRSASIACFLGDSQLATEIAQGLLANRIVDGVQILAESATLAEAVRPADAEGRHGEAAESPPVIRRQILSPFEPSEVVGEIRLTPDQREIDGQIAQATLFIGILMLAQILVSGLTVALVVYGYVTLPLRRLTLGLHALRVEHGAKLTRIRGHEQDEIGELVRYINRLIDRLIGLVVAERQLRRELEVEEQRFRSIFENAETGIFLVDRAGRLLSHNPTCRRMLNRARPDRSRLEPTLGDFFEDEERARGILELCIAQNRSIQIDLKLPDGRDDHRRDDQGERWIHLALSPIGNGHLQGVANDITERKRNELKAVEAAMTDPLTGLLNRMGFVRRLQECLQATAQGPVAWAALLLIDLDRFKQVNDTYGHAAGDQVLIGVAELLRGLVRKSDLVGRLGGDEFVILLTDIEQPEAIEKIARAILDGASRPYYIGDGRTARVGASVGVALSRLETVTQEQLFKQADEAMYHAKKGGRNNYCVYGRGGLADALGRQRQEPLTLGQALPLDVGIERPAPAPRDGLQAIEGAGDHAEDGPGSIGIAATVDDVDQRRLEVRGAE